MLLDYKLLLDYKRLLKRERERESCPIAGMACKAQAKAKFRFPVIAIYTCESRKFSKSLGYLSTIAAIDLFH